MGVLQDKVTRFVRVKWEDDESTYLALGFQVRIRPTLAFQQPRFFRQHQDWAQEEVGLALPPYTGSTGWAHYVANVRYMWAPHNIRLDDFSDPLFGGDGWETCVDDVSNNPVSFMASYDLASGEWDEVLVFDQESISGIPSIHEPVYSPAPGTVAAAIGTGSTAFWPEPEWEDISGGAPIIPEGGSGAIMAPVQDGQAPVQFSTTTTANLLSRGISCESTETRIDDFRAFECEGTTIGFVPEGGPVITPKLQASAEFATTSINFGAIGIEVEIEDELRTWEAVGAAHVPAVFDETSGLIFKRPTGILWVLMAAV